MASKELTELITEDIKCQCNKCYKVFTYKDIKRIKTKIYGVETEKPVCPYCENSFTNIDDLTLDYFTKHLYINSDERLF